MTDYTLATYSSLTTDINSILTNGLLTNITFYADSLGSSILNDLNGNNIEGKIISKISYTNPVVDSDSNVLTKGFMIVTFNDDSTLEVKDDIDNVWYKLNSTVMPKTIFGNLTPNKTSSTVQADFSKDESAN